MSKLIDHGEGAYPREDYTGPWEVYWPNGQLKWCAKFVNGKEQGEHICYWENGNLAQKCEMRDGHTISKCIYYHPNGVKSREGYCSEGGYNGIWTSYDATGKTMSQENWKDGVQEGECIEFDEEGNITCQGIYRDGEPYEGTFSEVRDVPSDNSTLWFLVVRRFSKGRDMGVVKSIQLDGE